MNLFRFNRASYTDNRLCPGSTKLFDPAGPIVISFCVMSVGLIFWITHVYVYLPHDLAEIREIWLGRPRGDLSLLDTFAFVCLFLGYWILFAVLRYWINAEKMSLVTLVLFVTNAVVVGSMGYILYTMRTTVLNDLLFAWQQEQQGVYDGDYYWGRVLDESPENCAPAPPPCVQVRLDDGRVVSATLGPRLNFPEAEIVDVASKVGGKTGEVIYYEVKYYNHGDADYIWWRLTGE